MASVTIAINGMSCGHCVAAVSKALAAVPGVTVESVQIGSATVAIDPALGSLSAAEAAIDTAGYDVVKGRVLNIAMADTRDGPSVA
jgi:copper chaperone